MKPVVALVGRPNVGKSALFNRIIQRRVSIVEDVPGVTRDRIYSEAEWSGKEFILVDTGGFETDARELQAMVRAQAEAAMQEADLIILVVDVKAGLTPSDHDIARLVRSGSRPVIVAANKADNPDDFASAAEFFTLGLGEPVPVSAIHGLGVGDLLDEVVKLLPAAEEEEVDHPEYIKVAIVGRPNVGKSSLVNAMLGQDRMIVSDVPGTTRDAVDIHWKPAAGPGFQLIDTAGLRRKSKIGERLDRFSASRSLKAIERCDVAVLVLDASEGVTVQDKKIAGYAHRQGKASVILVNKWDLIEKGKDTRQAFLSVVRSKINFMDYALVEFISARTGQRISRVPELIRKAFDSFTRKVKTSDLNRVIQDAIRVTPPPSVGGKQLNIFYGTQIKQKPPAFLFFINEESLVSAPYARYLEDRLRGAFDFEGTPIRLVWRSRE